MNKPTWSIANLSHAPSTVITPAAAPIAPIADGTPQPAPFPYPAKLFVETTT